MVRFTQAARTPRRSPVTDSLPTGRRLLRRLLDENVLLLRELEELRGLRETSHQDLLSALPNRRVFERRLAEELSRAARDPAAQGVLLVVDVNDSGVVNRRFGRVVGDRLLPDVGDMVQGALRDSDVCCSAGAGEFMVLLPETDPSAARLVMARLRVAVIRAGSRQDVPITISIGCAAWPGDSRLASELIQKADRARFAEKRRLRGQARRRPPKGGAKLLLVK